jgi:hypothetical protein
MAKTGYTYLPPALSGEAVADIFISYSHADKVAARELAAYLEAQGYSVWWDSNLKGGMISSWKSMRKSGQLARLSFCGRRRRLNRRG